MSLSIPSLVKDGLLTDDLFFIEANARDLEGKRIIGHQLLRLYGGVMQCDLEETLEELWREGLIVDEARSSNIAEAMKVQWETHRVFPGDGERSPQEFKEGIIPQVVRNACVRVYLPHETPTHLRDLVARYEGQHLRQQLMASCDEVDEDAFTTLLSVEQRQPIVVKRCQNPACKALVRTTLAQAVMAIQRFGLLPEYATPEHPYTGKLFFPHAKCVTCNRDRTWMKVASHTVASMPARSNASIGEVLAAQRAREQPKKAAAKKAAKKAVPALVELVTVSLEEGERS